jgi:hypothetical protein
MDKGPLHHCLRKIPSGRRLKKPKIWICMKYVVYEYQ